MKSNRDARLLCSLATAGTLLLGVACSSNNNTVKTATATAPPAAVTIAATVAAMSTPSPTVAATTAPTAVLAASASASASAPATAPTAAAAQPKEAAGDAVKRQLGYVALGQWGREWDELHPAQQQVISRAKYTDCATRATLPQISDIAVKETYDDPLGQASVPETTSKAVTVTYKANGSSTQSQTFHEVNVGGTWKRVLSDSVVEKYRAGGCG